METVINKESKADLKINTVNQWAGSFSGLMLVIMSLITVYDVFMRYFLNKPTGWVLEYSVYLFIWFGFLSIGYAQQKGRHITVDILTHKFPIKTACYWGILGNVLAFFTVAALVYYGFEGVMASHSSGEFAPTITETPLWIPRMVVPVGGLLLGLQLVIDIIKSVKELILLPPQDQKENHRTILYIAVFLILLALIIWLFTAEVSFAFVLLLLLFLFGGFPIYLSLFTTGLFGLYFGFGGFSGLEIISSVAYSAFDSFSLACLPLFILAGAILAATGAGKSLFSFFEAWFGMVPGGLLIATILSCAAFAAISTSSVATAATIGLIALPNLLQRKYDKTISYGTLAAGGTLGIMIPPAGSLIIYSSFTDESLGRLFMGGFSGGILLALLFCVFILVLFTFKGKTYERPRAYSWKERGSFTYSAVWVLMFPVIILGGIYTGVFTPLECGAVAVVYALAVPMVRGVLKFKDLPAVLSQSVVAASTITAIILGAMTMGYYFTLMRIPNKIFQFISDLGMSTLGFLVLLTIFYFILGMFLEVVSQLSITLPIIYPIIISMGIDGIWFGVFLTVLMELSLLTPPVGLNLYVIKSIANDDLWSVLKGTLPFWIIMFAALLLIWIFPEIVLWLPGIIK